MSLDLCAFAGWPNCLRLANEAVELVVTLDVGPRIIHFAAPGGENVLKINADELGGRGEPEFQARGGHRFWLAPENERTYAPDNDSVEHSVDDDGAVRLVNAAASPWFIEKELTVKLDANTSRVTLEHRATNRGSEPTLLATWALTVMRAGGLEIIPQPPMGQHPRDLLPNRLIVPWPYTDLSDERWRWGRDFITLEQRAAASPAKCGLAHRERWVGYAVGDALFVKTFGFEEGANYPDFGCNFETFTDAEMLEVETLSPLRTLAPGESLAHSETWHLVQPVTPLVATDEPALTAWLAPHLAGIL
jgi:hypothetical protein